MQINKKTTAKIVIVAGVIVTVLAMVLLMYHPFRRNIHIAVETLNAKMYSAPKEIFPHFGFIISLFLIFLRFCRSRLEL